MSRRPSIWEKENNLKKRKRTLQVTIFGVILHCMLGVSGGPGSVLVWAGTVRAFRFLSSAVFLGWFFFFQCFSIV